MTIMHTDENGIITKIEDESLIECDKKLLKAKGFDANNLENLKKLTPPIVEVHYDAENPPVHPSIKEEGQIE